MTVKRHHFEFHPEAMVEARAAADWYAERSANASVKFKQALRNAEQLVTDHPESWNSYLHRTRCHSLKRIPYGLVYVVRGELIVGIAVAHLKRRPGYWRKRLES